MKQILVLIIITFCLVNCSSTKATKPAIVSNLSASGSINLPNLVIMFLDLAMYPSKKSVKDAIMKIVYLSDFNKYITAAENKIKWAI